MVNIDKWPDHLVIYINGKLDVDMYINYIMILSGRNSSITTVNILVMVSFLMFLCCLWNTLFSFEFCASTPLLVWRAVRSLSFR